MVPTDVISLTNVRTPFRSITVRKQKGSNVRYKLAAKTLPISLTGLPVANGSPVTMTLEIVSGPKTGACFIQTVRCRLKRGQKQLCRP